MPISILYDSPAFAPAQEAAGGEFYSPPGHRCIFHPGRLAGDTMLLVQGEILSKGEREHMFFGHCAR